MPTDIDRRRRQEIGARIKAAREQQNLTQAQVGEWFGLTGKAVLNWERGNNLPASKRLGELGRRLGVDLVSDRGHDMRTTVRVAVLYTLGELKAPFTGTLREALIEGAFQHALESQGRSPPDDPAGGPQTTPSPKKDR